MKTTTLCLVRRNDEILLALKKRGFGAGKWNGAGGKVEAGESIRAAAARELFEEVGLSAAEDSLQHVGLISFTFENKPEWDLRMYIFLAHEFEGEPSESDEMMPRWYNISAIPYEEMWKDDPYWLPLVLAGQAVSGEFVFSEDGEEIISHVIHQQSSLAL